ncbi:MAG TPA: hypothetical protein VHL53_06485 [Acidimicrobiia bacterium]|nr:hypothetical protein [Acidimicrobiia bacterium]
MAKVMIEGDPGALEQIQAVLRSAGLGPVEVEWISPAASVAVIPPAPAHWAALAGHAPGLAYADWRDEILSLVDAPPPARGLVTALRRAG